MKLSDMKNYTVRMLPCSKYETVILENWLEDLAQQGLVLYKISFGIAIFEKQEPQELHYRLTVIPTKTDGYDNLNSKRELITLCANAGWRFICERGHFAIFATAGASAEEIHTEPELQYLDYRDYVKWSAVLGNILIFVLPVYVFWDAFLREMIGVTWQQYGGIYIALLAVCIANIAVAASQMVRSLLLYRKLKRNGISHEKKSWHSSALGYRISIFALLIVYVGGFGYIVWYLIP